MWRSHPVAIAVVLALALQLFHYDQAPVTVLTKFAPVTLNQDKHHWDTLRYGTGSVGGLQLDRSPVSEKPSRLRPPYLTKVLWPDSGSTVNYQQGTPVPEDTRIVVNAPAYRLDVFQAGKLIKSYRVAIGNPEFPLPSGLRKADSIIFNPTWIPPNEPWVESSKTVKVGKEIAAGDRLNPLGVIKIPIGSPSLIHGGKTPAQIGAFATHGCVGMTDRQVQDFAKLLARLGNVELSDREIAEHQKARSETKEMKLKTAIPVELRYETITVEGGNLHIYRDVYGRGTNSRERLESILKAYGGTLSGLTEVERTRVLESLKTMTQGAGGRAGSGNGRVRQGRGQQVVIVPVTSLAGKGQPVPVALDTGAGGGKPAVQKRKRI